MHHKTHPRNISGMLGKPYAHGHQIMNQLLKFLLLVNSLITLLILSHLVPQPTWQACLHGSVIRWSPRSYSIWQITHLFTSRNRLGLMTVREPECVEFQQLRNLYFLIYSIKTFGTVLKPTVSHYQSIQFQEWQQRKRLSFKSTI